VKKAMDRKMGEMMRKRLALRAGFPLRCLVGDHDVPEQRRFSW
jgi:hypothetical protein